MNVLGPAETSVASPVLIPGGRLISVKRGFGWTLAGYAVYMLCQWAMMVVLARLGSPDFREVALFALAIAATTPIILFSNLGLRRVYATDANSEFSFADYFKLRMATNVAALALITGVAVALGYPAAIVGTIVAMGTAKVIESTSDILHGYFQHRGRIDLGARATMMRGVLSLAGFLAVFLATGSVIGAIAGMAAGWTAVLVFYERTWALRLLRASPPARRVSGPARNWMHLAHLALPLGIVALVTSLKASIPMFVIETGMGLTALGLFAALIYFLHASNRVVSAMGEAAASRLSSLFKSGDERGTLALTARMLGVALLVSGAGIGVAVAVGGPLLRLFYGAPFAGLGGLLVAIMAATCVANLQTVLDYAMVATGRFRIQPYLYGGGALLLLILCVAFVPAKGLEGAALSLGIVSGVELLGSASVVGWSLLRLRSLNTPALQEAR